MALEWPESPPMRGLYGKPAPFQGLQPILLSPLPPSSRERPPQGETPCRGRNALKCPS
jgi:hypothetical protein